MLELEEQIRILIDEGAAPVLAREVMGQVAGRPPRASGVRRFGLVTVVTVAACVVLVVALVGLLTDTGGRNTITTASPHWQVAGSVSGQTFGVASSSGNVSYALVCPTTVDCYVAQPQITAPNSLPNGAVEASTDRGRTWHSVLVVPGYDLSGLTCPSAQVCAIAGVDFPAGTATATLYVTDDGGATWSHEPIAGGSLSSPWLSCTSASACVATTTVSDGQHDIADAQVTDDGGASWSTTPFPGTFTPMGLQCVASTTTCIATGQNPTGSEGLPADIHGTAAALFSTDGGRSWQAGTVPVADMVRSLSCADAQHCVALEQTMTGTSMADFLTAPLVDTVIATDDGGRTWQATAGNEPEEWSLDGVSCPTTLECWIVGATHTQGASAHALGDDPAGLASFVKVTEDGGRTWNSVPLPTVGGAVPAVGYVSCPATGACFALAQDPSPVSGPYQTQLVLSTAPSS